MSSFTLACSSPCLTHITPVITPCLLFLCFCYQSLPGLNKHKSQELASRQSLTADKRQQTSSQQSSSSKWNTRWRHILKPESTYDVLVAFFFFFVCRLNHALNELRGEGLMPKRSQSVEGGGGRSATERIKKICSSWLWKLGLGWWGNIIWIKKSTSRLPALTYVYSLLL